MVAQEIMDNGADWDLFWPLYLSYSTAGFEADHECNNPLCVNSCHLVWRTQEEHLELTLQRRRERKVAC